MDITLILAEGKLLKPLQFSFNPCFNGYYTYTLFLSSSNWSNNRFNPCFNGYYTYTDCRLAYMQYILRFQSLF